MLSNHNKEGPLVTTAAALRVLRPLRTRCNALVRLVAGQSRSSSTHTYASSIRPGVGYPSHQDAPLAIYPPPRKLFATAHAQDYKNNLELISHIYAIVESFRNAVSKATPSQNATRIPSLMSLCAVIIGQNMPTWEDEGEDEEDQDATEFVEQVYESLPTSEKRWLLPAHALSIILYTAPHHPTLIHLLLEETLSNRLQHLSYELLEALFLVALRPKPNGPAAICHSAHPKFLVDCLDQCLRAGMLASTFVQPLVRVLDQVQSPAVWASGAMDRLVRRLYQLDPLSCFALLTTLATYLSTSDLDGFSQLSDTLAQWLNILIARSCLSSEELFDPCDPCDSLFSLVQSLRPFCTVGSPHNADLQDVSMSLAFIWLAVYGHNAPLSYTNSVHCILATAAPRPSTFHSMATQLFSSLAFDQGKPIFQQYMARVQKYSLTRLEVFLWGSALYALENLESAEGLSPQRRKEIKGYRQEVMERVEEVESKLYEAQVESEDFDGWEDRGIITSVSASQSPWSKGGWRWESVLGCWVRQQAPELTSPTAIRERKRQISLITATPKKRFDRSPSTPHWTPISCARRQAPPSKKIPSLLAFTSVVAKTASQRIVLHPAVKSSDARQSSKCPDLAQKTGNREPNEAQSDDILDLLVGSP